MQMSKTWFSHGVTLLRALSTLNSNCAQANLSTASTRPSEHPRTTTPRFRRAKAPSVYLPRFKNGENKHDRWCSRKEPSKLAYNKVYALCRFFCGPADVKKGKKINKKKKHWRQNHNYLHFVFFKLQKPQVETLQASPEVSGDGKRSDSPAESFH